MRMLLTAIVRSMPSALTLKKNARCFVSELKILRIGPDIDPDIDYFKTLATLQAQVIAIDKQIQAKQQNDA